MALVKKEFVAHLVKLAYVQADGENLDAFINQTFILIQTAVHSTDGGLAGQWYTGDVIDKIIDACEQGDVDELVELFWDYAELENTYADYDGA